MTLTAADITFIGAGLDRPECVACTAAGEVFVSKREGVSRIGPDGTTTHRRLGPSPDWLINGFSIDRDGSLLLANLGDVGGVWRWSARDGLVPFLQEVDGEKLPGAVNYVGLDAQRRAWVSISTRLHPRDLAFRKDVDDGYIILVDAGGARIAAEGIGFTNESHIDPAGRHLYVNETYARRLSRFALAADGTLGRKEVVTEFRDGNFPDGMAFDANGDIWVACVLANRLVRVTPGGEQSVILDDCDLEICRAADAAWASDRFDRGVLDTGAARSLRNLASVAFGGPDLKTVYLGSLANTRLATFRSPIAGAKPHHWTIRPGF
jgi:sugar lactone lactonase YvrE